MSAATFYRTPQGSHRHTTWYCARKNQPVPAPEPTVIPADEVANWTPCSDCCTEADVKAAAETAAPAPVYCTGQMVPANPRRLYRKCECGYEGKVTANGLRAHKPQR